MFKSKQRPLAIPQWEHQKLAGTLALLWGNAAFERPPVPFDSFVMGVGLHDRAYGPLDNLPIGEVPEQDWVALTLRGFEIAWPDATADLIAKMHLQRLMRYGSSSPRQAQAAAMGRSIAAFCERHGLDRARFERIDRITHLCDRIAFDFCFEKPAEGEIAIFPENKSDTQVGVRYRIAAGSIEVDPWPFGVESHTAYLVGYHLDGYPDVLNPFIVPYRLGQRAK